MSGIDANKLKQIQENWAEVSLDIPGQVQHSIESIILIVRGLEEMGLDLDQDETYELVAPDLTRVKFAQTRTYLNLLEMLESYYESQTSRKNYRDYDPIFSRLYELEQVREYYLPEFEKNCAQAGLPEGVNDVAMRQLALIRQMEADGTLEREVKIAAQAVAIENFRMAVNSRRELEKPQHVSSHNPYSLCKSAAILAAQAMEAIEKAQEFYSPAEVTFERGRLGWGWSPEKMQFDRAAVKDLQEYFFLKQCALDFANALDLQGKGHFIADSSDSGKKVMPMQEILSRLYKHKFDIRDKEVYTKMGTDIDTFWNAYQRERREVSQNDRYNLIKPEFNR